MITYRFVSFSYYLPQSSETVEKIEARGAQDVSDINRLLTQLSEKPRLIEFKGLLGTVMNLYLLVARDENEDIRGMASLRITNDVFDGIVGHIGNVVVDTSLRGQNIGENLMTRLMQKAKELWAERLELTSNPKRIAANGLYQKLGFKLRETNCYEMKL